MEEAVNSYADWDVHVYSTLLRDARKSPPRHSGEQCATEIGRLGGFEICQSSISRWELGSCPTEEKRAAIFAYIELKGIKLTDQPLGRPGRKQRQRLRIVGGEERVQNNHRRSKAEIEDLLDDAILERLRSGLTFSEWDVIEIREFREHLHS
jgi:hypothetical protein